MVESDEQPRTPDASLSGEEADERRAELSRIISLSDGVFAFAMTLLVISIEVPDISKGRANTELGRDVFELWPQILSYVIGFLVIAGAWGSHRRIYSRVRDYDSFLTRVNVALLLMVAFLPFPTGLVGQYGRTTFAAMFYAACIAPISLLYVLILDHLDDNRGLLTRNGAGYDFALAKARHLVTAAIFIGSIPLALIDPGLPQLSWLLLIFNHQFAERLIPHLPRRLQSADGQS